MVVRLFVGIMLLLIPVLGHAQTIHGVVVEEGTTDGIAAAEIELVDEDGEAVATARTNRAGTFLLQLRGSGTFTLRLTHISFTTVESDAFELRPQESLAVELRMAREAIPLEPLVVTARADARGVAGMHERMRRLAAEGRFVTREEIDRRPGSRVTEFLRGMPGVVLLPAGSGGAQGNHITMRGLGFMTGVADRDIGDVSHSPTDQCDPTIYVDGIVMPQGEAVDIFLRPDMLEGVEVYTNGSAAPAPLLPRSNCGVVAFWTRADGMEGSNWVRRLAAWAGAMALVFTIASR